MMHFAKTFIPTFIIGYLLLVVVISLLEHQTLVFDDPRVWLVALPVPLILSIGLGIKEARSHHVREAMKYPKSMMLFGRKDATQLRGELDAVKAEIAANPLSQDCVQEAQSLIQEMKADGARGRD